MEFKPAEFPRKPRSRPSTDYDKLLEALRKGPIVVSVPEGRECAVVRASIYNAMRMRGARVETLLGDGVVHVRLREDS